MSCSAEMDDEGASLLKNIKPSLHLYIQWLFFYTAKYTYVTLDHKTSHKGQFFVRDTTIWKSGIWGCKKNQNIEKITFKVVQINCLAMQITNKKCVFLFLQ